MTRLHIALIFLLGLCTATVSYAQVKPGFHQAVTLALEHNADYRASVEQQLADKEKLPQARSLLLPQVDFVAGKSYEELENIYTDENSLYYDPDSTRSRPDVLDTMWRLSFNQSIFDYSALNNFRSAKAEVYAAEYRLKAAQQKLIYKVVERYLNMLYKGRQVYLNKGIYDALSAKLEQVQRAMDLGVGDRLEVLEVRARLDLTRNDLLQAKSELEDEQMQLLVLTGQYFTPPEGWFRGAPGLSMEKGLDPLEVWLDKATSNPEYLLNEALAKASDYRSKASLGGHLPVFSLGMNYSYRESQDEFRDREGWTASLEMRLPLFHGGKTSSKIREEEARYRFQKATSESLLENTLQLINLAYARLGNTAMRLEALEQSVDSSEKYLEAAERGVSLNLRSQVDVLDARTQLLDVQLKLAEAANKYFLADLDLHFQTGMLSLDRVASYDRLLSEGYDLNL